MKDKLRGRSKSMRAQFAKTLLNHVLLLCLLLSLAGKVYAQSNVVLGEVELTGATSVEQTSGVWVDGQYLGYLQELKGSKKILLLPGNTRSPFDRTVTMSSPKQSRFDQGENRPSQ